MFCWYKCWRLYDWYSKQPIIGEYALIRSRTEEQQCPNPETVRQLFSDKMKQYNKLYGNEPSSQQYQQRFRNPSHISDTVTVNYTRSLPQQWLHTIVNNQNMCSRQTQFQWSELWNIPLFQWWNILETPWPMWDSPRSEWNVIKCFLTRIKNEYVRRESNWTWKKIE